MGTGLRSKISSALSRFSAIQSGSPLIFDSSLDHLARDALAGAQLSLLVLDDRAGLGDPRAVNRGHAAPRF